jgi:hypothetical protein
LKKIKKFLDKIYLNSKMNIKESIFSHKIQNLESLESYFLTAVKKFQSVLANIFQNLKFETIQVSIFSVLTTLSRVSYFRCQLIVYQDHAHRFLCLKSQNYPTK